MSWFSGTVELFARRLTVKKILEYVRSTLSVTSDAKSIADHADDLQDGVKDGAWMQDEADKKLQHVIERVVPILTEVLCHLNSLGDAKWFHWRLLCMCIDQQQDNQLTCLGHAWRVATGIAVRDEDSSLEEILNYIKDHFDLERWFGVFQLC